MLGWLFGGHSHNRNSKPSGPMPTYEKPVRQSVTRYAIVDDDGMFYTDDEDYIQDGLEAGWLFYLGHHREGNNNDLIIRYQLVPPI